MREIGVFEGEGGRLEDDEGEKMSLEDSRLSLLLLLNGPKAQEQIGPKARPKTKPKFG